MPWSACRTATCPCASAQAAHAEARLATADKELRRVAVDMDRLRDAAQEAQAQARDLSRCQGALESKEREVERLAAELAQLGGALQVAPHWLSYNRCMDCIALGLFCSLQGACRELYGVCEGDPDPVALSFAHGADITLCGASSLLCSPAPKEGLAQRSESFCTGYGPFLFWSFFLVFHNEEGQRHLKKMTLTLVRALLMPFGC